ncbi:type 4a pilus biogenesis protein PilO [Candidatus Parcubacteria bacterium]|nr:type 4a pilus biogenesis protein PilO [Candidatus Parcubacteria bacterium]
MNLNNNFNLDIKKKITIRALVSLILFFSIIYFFTFPLLKKIKIQKEDIIAKKIELENKISQDKNITNLNEQIKKIEPGLLGLDKIFISINRELDFITLLESVAGNNNIEQKLNITPNQVKKDNDTYQAQPLVINANGKFKNIIQYIADLEALTYYITINSISINKIDNIGKNDENQNDSVKLTINGLTYWK